MSRTKMRVSIWFLRSTPGNDSTRDKARDDDEDDDEVDNILDMFFAILEPILRFTYRFPKEKGTGLRAERGRQSTRSFILRSESLQGKEKRKKKRKEEKIGFNADTNYRCSSNVIVQQTLLYERVTRSSNFEIAYISLRMRKLGS
ncbi:hypothetical protein HZH68_009232 [Vespula germanica]|uniref:Uncharacterized protein n=1 Tax=Vespula germanica TaxID=30212 RepID=A0A834JVL1_VESGE|nr:hypothetical protein HZH68_009232 [Vespula germanica]